MRNWYFSMFMFLVTMGCNNNNENTTRQAVNKQEEMLQNLEAAVLNNPDSTHIRMRLINALDSLKYYDEAIKQADSLIMRDSLNNGFWMTKAQLQESNKDTANAVISYERALRIYPSVDGQLYLANLLAESRNKRALVLARNVLGMGLGKETDANAHFVAGVYFARTGANKQAIQSFDRAINDNYTLMEAYMEKGFIFFDEKEYKQALQIFEVAISVNKTYADAYYWTAKSYEALGDKNEALTNYERSLGLDRDLSEAREAIKRLAN